MEQDVACPEGERGPRRASEVVVHIAVAIAIAATILLLAFTLF